MKKLMVLDTSAILNSGVNILNNLGPDAVAVIPTIVISELEDKRSHPTLGRTARLWLHLIEKVRHQPGYDSGGAAIPGFIAPIRIERNHSSQESLPRRLQTGSNDSTILAVAHNLWKEHFSVLSGNVKPEDVEVILISDDLPMRINASIDLNIAAVDSLSILPPVPPFTGYEHVFISDEDFIELSDNKMQICPDRLASFFEKNGVKPKESHILLKIFLESDPSRRVGAFYKDPDGLLYALTPRPVKTAGIAPRTPNQSVALAYLSLSPQEVPIVSLSGNAGTGKTLLAMAAGVAGVKAKRYDKIMILRSLHELGEGQEMGFLPGDVNAKMGPWGGAIFDALNNIPEAKTLKKKNVGDPNAVPKTEIENWNFIEINPITYLRGRSLSNMFLIIEEAQNFSRTELLNIISRVGEGTKVVLTWDAWQVDNKFLKSGKNSDVWFIVDQMKNDPLFSHIVLEKTERSKVAELASRILETM